MVMFSWFLRSPPPSVVFLDFCGKAVVDDAYGVASGRESHWGKWLELLGVIW
jgi:hypothetical protein